MKIELLFIFITGLVVYNIYNENKYIKLLLKYKKYRFISLASDRLVVEKLSDFYRTEREELDEKVFVLLLHIRSGGGHYQVLRNKVSKELELKYHELPELVKEEFNREVVRN